MNTFPKISNFTDRKVSVKRAMAILAKNKIHVDEDETAIILDFLYHIANTYKWPNGHEKAPNLKRKSNQKKMI